jgi:multidrug transporter EmrE-like cation transporter
MIFNRPQNLVLGAVAAIFNVVALILAANHTPIDPATYAGINIALAAIITLIAYQPPTLNPGDTFHVTTAAGTPNVTTVVATPPAADAPPTPAPAPNPPVK